MWSQQVGRLVVIPTDRRLLVCSTLTPSRTGGPCEGAKGGLVNSWFFAESMGPRRRLLLKRHVKVCRGCLEVRSLRRHSQHVGLSVAESCPIDPSSFCMAVLKCRCSDATRNTLGIVWENNAYHLSRSTVPLPQLSALTIAPLPALPTPEGRSHAEAPKA